MLSKQFNSQAWRIIKSAKQEARTLNHAEIGTGHLLLALLRDNGPVAPAALKSLGLSRDEAYSGLAKIVPTLRRRTDARLTFSPRVDRVAELSIVESDDLGHRHLGPEHLLLGILREGSGTAMQVLSQAGIRAIQVRSRIYQLLAAPHFPLLLPGTGPVDLLDWCTGDLTAYALARHWSHPVGRTDLIAQLLRILSRTNVNNLLILGRSGVGKTALVLALAAHMARNRLLGGRSRWRIRTLQTDEMYRQMSRNFEQTVRAMRKALGRRPDTLLFIDDVHEVITHRQGQNLMSGLADLIADGRVIAAGRSTDLDVVTTAPGFWSQFQSVTLADPEPGEAVDMLASQREFLGFRHGARIQDSGLVAAVELGAVYRPDLGLPGNAIELIGGAATQARAVAGLRKGEPAEYLLARLMRIQQAIATAIEDGDMVRASLAREEERAVRAELDGYRTVEVGQAEVRALVALDISLTPDTTVESMEEPITVVPTVAAVRPHRLPDRSKSTAILIGAGEFTDSNLPELPTSWNNLCDLAQVLGDETHGTFAAERIHIFDRFEHTDLRRIHDLAVATDDTLLIYYTGHGLNEAEDLYLAYEGTDSTKARLTALPYDSVRHIVLASRVARTAIILDCCYAGKAFGFMADNGMPTGELDIRGAYVLTATAGNKKALAPPGDRNSVFTAALLRILRDGVDTDSEFVHLDEIYFQLFRDLAENGYPTPRQRNDDLIAGLALTRNRKWRPPADGAATSPH